MLNNEKPQRKTKAGHKQSVGNDFPAVLWDNKASVDCCNVLSKSCQTGVPTAEKLCKRGVFKYELIDRLLVSELHPESSLPSLREIH